MSWLVTVTIDRCVFKNRFVYARFVVQRVYVSPAVKVEFTLN